MGIGETDWLAQEYRREGRPITPQAAARLAREHMVDCDAKGIRVRHAMECNSQKLKRETLARARREGGPPWPKSARSRKLTWANQPVTFREELQRLWRALTR